MVTATELSPPDVVSSFLVSQQILGGPVEVWPRIPGSEASCLCTVVSHQHLIIELHVVEGEVAERVVAG